MCETTHSPGGLLAVSVNLWSVVFAKSVRQSYNEVVLSLIIDE